MGLNLAQNLPNLQLSLRCMWASNQSECLSRAPDDQIQTLCLVHIQNDKRLLEEKDYVLENPVGNLGSKFSEEYNRFENRMV